MSDSNICFTYGEGIEYALEKLSIPSDRRSSFNHDAQIIKNAFIEAMADSDPIFRKAFRGMSFARSYMDGIKIDLPEEFDMFVVIRLSCCALKPILVPNRTGFIFLSASGSLHPCVRQFGNEGRFVSRLAMRSWLFRHITAVMPRLQRIRCSRRHIYDLEYTSHDNGVGHTLLAIDHNDTRRRISFDFVPVFEFQASQWIPGLKIPKNSERNWIAVPRKYFKEHSDEQDERSFMLVVPSWEQLVLHKKQNLKDSLRLMLALRDAQEMGALVIYFLKIIYLYKVQGNSINWNQAPGRILIRMLVILQHSLVGKRLPIFPNHFEKISEETRRDYIRIINRMLRQLIRCRNADCLTDDDLFDIFGV
ncbi:uncharacterized protein LOC6556777 [Drosophila grimshawi]|uniref:GH15966 n=1 Tax=Drosophila grimshawi TaxID=7222 RepID=B4J1Y8_DROGR|nr:uncharacterized protein LOC6556777 [Drosophila grimshawi]EDV95913.1 GH15966 [Drosophila grimshawi]